MLAARRQAIVTLTAVLFALPCPAGARQLPTLTAADYGRWESIGTTELSRDGAWLAYVVTRVDEDSELRIRQVAADSTRVVEFATRPVFSPDGRWLAYSIGVSEQERQKLESSEQPYRSKAGLLDLRTGRTTVIDNITDFAFSGDSRHIALRGYAVEGRKSGGVDVIVRDLERGVDTNFGNVGSFQWQEQGSLLAMTIDAENRAGNGVRIYDAGSGTIRTLDGDTAEYTGLVWRKGADDLAVLRERSADGYEEPGHGVLVWRGLAGSKPTQRTFEPTARAAFPAEHRVVEHRELQWSDDGATLFFGIQPWTRRPAPPRPDSAAKPAPKREDPAGVEVWHAADVDIIPEQKVRASMERNRSMVVAWHLDGDRFVQLTSDAAVDVTLSDGRYALATDGRPYDRERMFGPAYRDLVAVDVTTGERRKVIDRVQFHYGPSETGRYILYVRDDHYWTYDTRSGTHTNITRNVPTSFINYDDDHTVDEKPPYGTGGWTVGDRSVLLYDKYDVWEVRPDGTAATNLTRGAADRVRHRRAWLSPDDRVVDLSKPVYVTLYAERTKRSGYARLRSSVPSERLVFLDRAVSRLTRAQDAEVYLYRVEGAADSPDYFVGGPRLADARQVTETNPFQREYAWTRGELIDYRNTHGQELQAALLYPAGYEPGKKYPMIVYLYELTSSTLHSFAVPSERDAYNTTVFTQNGYFVLRPDIVYRGRNPGISAVEALLPAVDRVLETGMVDPGRVGIIGHSWGAYQTAFAVTQTDRFAAAVAGAPLADLISMYLSIYWNTGGTDARIFEIQQGRMEVPFWEDVDAYIRNSPVFSVRNMKTPLLVAFGDRDGAVDWHQGIELYNAARRAGKDMVMLVYEGENHSLSKKANQLDYHRRINEWFGHFLEGEPAPAWITSGVKHLARERQLELIRRGGNGGGH